MNDIRSYMIINKNASFIINFLIIISIIFLFSFILICQFKYKKYFYTLGQVIENENKYQLVLYLTPYKINIIKNNNRLIIDDFEYEYSIVFIENDYIISSDYNNYLKVVLDIKLRKKDMISNNILQVKILESNKKIFYYLKDYFVKGEIR